MVSSLLAGVRDEGKKIDGREGIFCRGFHG
jgi:hypothetical protein